MLTGVPLLVLASIVVAQVSQVPQELKDLTLHGRGVSTTAAYWEQFRLAFRWDFGATEIQWRRSERPDSSTDWRQSTNTFTTSYEITAACARAGGDDVFVAGKQDDGDVVIERWTFSPKDGRWRHIPPPMVPIGSPMPAYIGTTEIKGGTWSSPKATHPSPRRTVILEANTHSLVRGMQVDPEGRFLLFQDHDDGTLYRIRLDLGQPGTPETLFTAAQIPALAHTVWINVCDQISSGHRFWVLFEPDTEAKLKGDCACLLLWDPDNNGNLDTFDTMSFNDYLPLFQPTATSPANPCRFPWKAP